MQTVHPSNNNDPLNIRRKCLLTNLLTTSFGHMSVSERKFRRVSAVSLSSLMDDRKWFIVNRSAENDCSASQLVYNRKCAAYDKQLVNARVYILITAFEGIKKITRNIFTWEVTPHLKPIFQLVL